MESPQIGGGRRSGQMSPVRLIRRAGPQLSTTALQIAIVFRPIERSPSKISISVDPAGSPPLTSKIAFELCQVLQLRPSKRDPPPAIFGECDCPQSRGPISASLMS